jgi:DNA modification methylase
VKPYYDHAGITLYHGDCRGVLPVLPAASADLILTDPPYGREWESGYRQQTFGPMEGDDGTLPLLDVLRLSLRVLRRARHLYCFGLRDFGDLPIGGRAELVWDKGIVGMGDLTLPWGPAHETILFGVYEPSKVNRRDASGRLSARLRRGSVLREDRPNGSGVQRHPSEKPVGILRQMIESSSMLGDLVLDPFAGSGSTLEAARLEDRRAVGIEIEERYCEVAAKRLEQGVFSFKPASEA